MGGEHLRHGHGIEDDAGSSPHGRGTLHTTLADAGELRIIPAWAGNTASPAQRSLRIPDHPRMGGEHCTGSDAVVVSTGSSPHGRGTRLDRREVGCHRRIIPAWAGNTRPASMMNTQAPDHPRMGGEHLKVAPAGLRLFGSSPHGRGTLQSVSRCGRGVRIIPAWAGNTGRGAARHFGQPDHPRMGGEHRHRQGRPAVLAGSSPHGRGTRPSAAAAGAYTRIIPAWAGNTAPLRGALGCASDHPRMGGEHTRNKYMEVDAFGSSPHGRGTPPDPAHSRRDFRIIPAWAGNTTPAPRRSRRAPDHPRMGGEHSGNPHDGTNPSGSSPHGRGTRTWPSCRFFCRRIIPAWAGNTWTPRWCPISASDHPRMGGEHINGWPLKTKTNGSSPHGRGTLFS